MTKGGRSQIVTIRERLSDRLLKLLERHREENGAFPRR